MVDGGMMLDAPGSGLERAGDEDVGDLVVGSRVLG